MAADVANGGNNGPGKITFYFVKYFFNVGCFTISNSADDIAVTAVNIFEDGADIFDGFINLAAGVVDMSGFAFSINTSGAGNKNRLSGRGIGCCSP